MTRRRKEAIYTWVFLAALTPVVVVAGEGSQARVEGDSATFVFPVAEQETLEWNKESSSASGLEWAWLVEFRDGRTSYSLGFTYWKDNTEGPVTGTLTELLAAGQVDLWRGNENIQQRAAILESRGGELVMRVSSPEVLKVLHTVKPRKVALRWYLGGAQGEKRVRVQYAFPDL